MSGYDPHITRMLELECFGVEWVKEYGTVCKCGSCNPPKPTGAPAFKPNLDIVKPRHKMIDGIAWPVPDGVPDNAHLVVNEGRWGYANHFNEGMWKWTDEVTGKPMAYRVAGIGDLTPAFRQQAEFYSGMETLRG